MGKQYRQGDVLITAVDRIPSGSVTVPRIGGEVVLAYGEATGHRHAIADRHVELLSMSSEQIDKLYLRIVGVDAVLTHQEHDPITLPPGSYRVLRQREYAPVIRERESRPEWHYVDD